MCSNHRRYHSADVGCLSFSLNASIRYSYTFILLHSSLGVLDALTLCFIGDESIPPLLIQKFLKVLIKLKSAVAMEVKFES